MADLLDASQAALAVNNPVTTKAVLADIAAHYPDLWPQIATHPRAYPGLLDWLSSVGDAHIKAIVAQRRGSDAIPSDVVVAPINQHSSDLEVGRQQADVFAREAISADLDFDDVPTLIDSITALADKFERVPDIVDKCTSSLALLTENLAVGTEDTIEIVETLSTFKDTFPGQPAVIASYAQAAANLCGMVDVLVSQTRDLVNQLDKLQAGYPEDPLVARYYATSIFYLAITPGVRVSELYRIFNSMQILNARFADDLDIAQVYANLLSRIICDGSLPVSEDEELLDALASLSETWPDDDSITCEYATALVWIIGDHRYSVQESDSYVQELLEIPGFSESTDRSELLMSRLKSVPALVLLESYRKVRGILTETHPLAQALGTATLRAE